VRLERRLLHYHEPSLMEILHQVLGGDLRHHLVALVEAASAVEAEGCAISMARPPLGSIRFSGR
jgi:hypothetical protein